MTDKVLVVDQDHIRLITINRPEVHNAVNADVWVAISEALSAAEIDQNVRVVILTGSGSRSFCAGADLRAVSRGESLFGDNEVARSHGFAGFCRHPISKPTIAAVNGNALGGGTELVLAADICVASETATLGLPEVTRGIVAGGGGALRLINQVPEKVAMEILFTGKRISAQQAHDLGLVNSVVPQGDLLSSAIKLGEEISKNAPLAVQATKRIALGMSRGVRVSEADLWEINARERDIVKKSEDAREGPLAFVEKREPRWGSR